MREENELLRRDMATNAERYEHRIRELLAARPPAAAPVAGGDPDTDPATARVIKLLRKAVAQEKGLRSKDVPTTLTSLLNALEARRTALAASEAATAEAAAAVLQRDGAEERATAATTRLSDVSATKAQLEGRVAGLQEDLADARARLRELEEGGGGVLVPATPRTPGFGRAGGEMPVACSEGEVYHMHFKRWRYAVLRPEVGFLLLQELFVPSSDPPHALSQRGNVMLLCVFESVVGHLHSGERLQQQPLLGAVAVMPNPRPSRCLVTRLVLVQHVYLSLGRCVHEWLAFAGS